MKRKIQVNLLIDDEKLDEYSDGKFFETEQELRRYVKDIAEEIRKDVFFCELESVCLDGEVLYTRK